MMVVLWEIREETNPELRIDIKYPDDINRKNDPEPACDNPSSPSITGRKGAKIILEKKLVRKITAR
jgi:hypothetical protein